MYKRLASSGIVCFAMSCALIVSTWAGAKADDLHLPSITITPTAIFATSAGIVPASFVAPVNGNVVLNGSIKFPLFKGVSASYDHYSNGLIWNTTPPIVSGGKIVDHPLELRDIIDTVRLDAPLFKGVTAELATLYRHRTCCPGDTDPTNSAPQFYHDNYLALSYASSPFPVLNGAQFIYSITGHESPHNSESPATAAATTALGFASRRTEYGITQAVTAAVPIDAKSGLSVAGTYTWGAFNYFSNLSYPITYGIWILNLTKVFDKNVSFFASVDNYVQRPQGYPFGPAASGGLIGASLNIGLNLHLGP